MSLAVETHDIGNFFWHTIRLEKTSPLVHRFPTNEIDSPYRWSNSVIVRLPFTCKAVTLGWWHSTDRTEEQAILAAMSGREVDHTTMTFKEKDSALQVLAANAIDLDDEMELGQMVGVL